MSAAAGVTATWSINEFTFFVIIITLIIGISFELPDKSYRGGEVMQADTHANTPICH